MSCLSRYRERYAPIPNDDEYEEGKHSELSSHANSRSSPNPYRSWHHPFHYIFRIAAVGLVGLAVGFIACLLLLSLKSFVPSSGYSPGPQRCSNPSLRREWRSLAETEKRGYIEAVQCLTKKSSTLGLNQSLYDDFAWIHKRIGEYSHDAAPFLAWHRYFIHVYESYLRDRCDYTGSLTYWDWTLDWENITTSPVWDSVLGFGGDGNKSAGPSYFNGYCVTDGPFAMLEIPYLEDISLPHCLLRGFENSSSLLSLGRALSPAKLEALLASADYETFNLGLENGPHIAIPRSINGDFSLHTAPFDPVFFLHHTQLDRMWWRWQHRHPGPRAREYLGRASTNSSSVAALSDSLPMGDLAPAVRVAEIMNTQGGLLCYEYF